jgi:outer membrane protein assembly factor BamE (lipoprotein component of BamABCDE complex)
MSYTFDQKMKSSLTAIFLAFASVCSGDTLRISELANAAGDGSERMTLKTKDGEEELFVKTKTVIADGDVKEAWPDPTSGGQISVKLNEDGGEKLKQTTAAMQHGRDRLAIIVDGVLISAPVVQATLGSSFVISGFKDKDFNDLDDLARKMSGRPPRPEGQDPEPPKAHPKVETVPFTEEEYQANKAMREKMGLYHIESVPTEQELNKVLNKGMGREEVFKLFGKPYMASDKPHDDDFYFIYQIAPEKRPDNPKREVLPDGFKVDFTDGKLSRWSHTYSNASREEKVVGREDPTLRAILPEIDFLSGDVDFFAYIEGIVIPDPKQSVNKRDLGDLISIVMMVSSSFDEDSKKATLNADCDLMKTLSHSFPDVAALRQGAKNGRVRIDKLNEILSPYAFGEKELPVKTKQVEQGGTGQPATRPESKSEAGDKPQSESEGRSR